jgi:general secretion pathway protein D
MERVCNQARSRRAARSFSAIVALCAMPLLSSCSYLPLGPAAPGDIDVLDKVRSLDIQPRQAQNVGATQPRAGERSRTAVFEGTNISEIPQARAERAATGNGYDLNFENTPIATVAKVVLGDILNTGYVIDRAYRVR